MIGGHRLSIEYRHVLVERAFSVSTNSKDLTGITPQPGVDQFDLSFADKSPNLYNSVRIETYFLKKKNIYKVKAQIKNEEKTRCLQEDKDLLTGLDA
jgi:hypothetical protein